jgi:cytoplasmic iron level regulating protein YaaA (DUF328/UPF0246 family)
LIGIRTVARVLIVLPPSESKRPPSADGAPVVLDSLSFPTLGATRARVLEALLATSAGPDAFRRLHVGPAMAGEVERNTRLRELPARPALEVYSGPLHQGLDAASLSPVAAARAADEVVVVSSLWGLLRPVDRIPPYRLHLDSRLLGMGRLSDSWRAVLPRVLAVAAGPSGVVLDLRSPGYQATGMPDALGDRTVSLRVPQSRFGDRMGDVVAKRVRGQAARHLLESGESANDPQALADMLADRWPVELASPARAGGTWTLSLFVGD